MAADRATSPRLHVIGDADTTADPTGLLRAGLDVAYQPIVQLGSGSVIAYEALARPRHRSASDPVAFFRALEGVGLRLDGERLAFCAAVDGLDQRFPRVKLFVNASPSTLVDDDFDVLELLDLAEHHGLAASDLVVEVTESEAIHDLDALARRTDRLRRLGIGLAVDDAGAGHASFRVITRLRPSYIKIDRELVSGVDTDGARHAFIDAMVRFSRQIGSRLIAEGIETDGELVSLAALGVEAGQGYYLAYPAVGEFRVPSPASRRKIASTAQRLRLGSAQVTAGEVARPAAVVDERLTVREAYARFLAEPSLGTLVLVEPDTPQRFAGQLARRSLERYLSGPEVWEQLADRTIGDIADRHPVTVVAPRDVVEVAAVLGSRHSQEVVDDIVVTDPRGDLVGVLSVRDVLRTLADVRDKDDQDVDPRSGLRGPAWVEGELSRRLRVGEATTTLFVDLDGFRRINDLCGFSAGDDVIRTLSRSLSGVAASVQGAVVAHVGADDFVLLVPPHGYEELVSELVHRVEGEVIPFVRTLLRLHHGDEHIAVTLSIGAVDLSGEPPPGHRYLEWAQTHLAPLIQTAKGHPDHACVRRSGRTTALSTWTPAPAEQRTLRLGLAEPSVVLRTLDLIDRSWAQWWEESHALDGGAVEADRFPGPLDVAQRLRRRYAVPLRDHAQQALAAGTPVIEATITGEQEELLAMLDRIALVTHRASASRSFPIPPEMAVLDSLLRQRARVLRRQDRINHDPR